MHHSASRATSFTLRFSGNHELARLVHKIPWEITDQYIRSGHRDPSDFEQDSLRTITLSEEEGIRAVIGKPKGSDTTQIQSYLFDKDKWTLEKAKAWFNEHHREARHEHFCYVTPILEKIVDKPLKIRGVALTASMSRNLNIYTPDELQNFASKLTGSPVYLEHVSAFNSVGKVTKAEWNPETKTLTYEAEIYDEETAEKIRKGLVQHVSVGADYERIDILDGKVPHGLHNAELSLVAVPGIPQTNIQVMEKREVTKQAFPLHAVALVNDFKVDGTEEYITPREYILGFHRDPYSFLPEHFSTIWLDRENGILALIGRLRNQPESRRIQSILFSKEKMWDEPKIRDWFLLHPHYLIESKSSPSAKDDQIAEQIPWKADKTQIAELSELKEREGAGQQTERERRQAPKEKTIEDVVKLFEEKLAEINKRIDEITKLKPQIAEAEWTTEYINNLPDESFAYIEPGGTKDEQGKTTPRSLRHLPYKDAQGNPDPEHVRNALARLNQTQISAEGKAEAKRKLCAAAKELNIASEVCGLAEQKEPAGSKPEQKSLAEELLKHAPALDPNLIDKREILRLLPEERVVRSWSYGPRLLVHQLRHKLSTTSRSSMDRE